jgi:Flp pilus assembly CpaE family ATPase
VHRLVRALGDLGDLVPGTPRSVVVNRVRASVAGSRPEEAVRDALARYAGVSSATLLPDDRGALDAALLEARTLREASPSSPVRKALTALAHELDAAVPVPAHASPGTLRRLRRRASSEPSGREPVAHRCRSRVGVVSAGA